MTAAILALSGFISSQINTVEGLLHWGKTQLRKPGIPVARLLHRHGVRANQVTGSRILAPAFVWLSLSYEYTVPALIVFALASWTDSLDGIMAEDEEKEEGKKRSGIYGLFDSLVDKVFIISIYALSYQRFENLVTLTAVGEIIYGSLAVLYLLGSLVSGADMDTALEKVKSNNWGKYKMGFEVATAICMMAYFEIPHWLVDWAVRGFGWTAFGFLICSFFGKLKTAFS